MSKARVFISYRAKEPDRVLAREFYDRMTAVGHEPFLAEESIRWGEKWPQRIEDELRRCDYFLLLLSQGASESEMVVEEVRQARYLQQSSADGRPHILPLRVQFGLDEPLSYDLNSYLGGIQQRQWDSDEDTPAILGEILELISAAAPPAAPGPAAASPNVAVETPDRPPLPAASPELPEGQVALASKFYVERPPVEAESFAQARQPGALVCIKAPRQMGKTSLMARLLREARRAGCRTVTLNLQLEDGSVFSNLNTLTQWFCSVVGDALELENKVESHWKKFLPSKRNCTTYFEKCILRGAESPVLVAMDEVDRLFDYPSVVSEFFGLLRGWKEKATDDETWQNLRLVLVHSTESYADPNINQSPLDNVGFHVRLPDFTREQVLDLSRLHGDPLGPPQVEELMRKVGGHPYLVRVALYRVTRGGVTLAELLRHAATEEGVYSDHLRRHLWTLSRHPNLAEAMGRVARAGGAVRLDSMDAFKLEGMGLVRRRGNDVTARYDLYREYFSDRL